MVKNPRIGQKVSYEDTITPREVGTITEMKFINRKPSYYECVVVWDGDRSDDNYDYTISSLRSEGWRRVR